MDAPKTKQRYLILVVDQQTSLLKRIHSEFSRRGLQVKGTKFGKKALEYLTKNQVHLILCSEKASDMTGLVFYKEFTGLQQTRRIPFIFLSSSQGFKNQLQLLKPGPDDVWSRSLSSYQFFTKVKSVIQKAARSGRYRKGTTERVTAGKAQAAGSEELSLTKTFREFKGVVRQVEQASALEGLSASQLEQLHELEILVREGKESIRSNKVKEAQNYIQLIQTGLKEMLLATPETESTQPRETQEDFDEEENIERRNSMSKIEQLVESISSIGGITKLVIASKDGTVLSKQGVKGDQFGSFITFIALSAEHVRTTMGFSVLNHIILNRNSGEKLLILVGPKIILGVELGSTVSPVSVVDSLKPIVNRVSV